MASVILGEWTHRRGDRGGLRAVAAEIERPRPSVAWSWRPEHGGHVDQVRIVGQNVLVATMMPRDASAPGWEHAVVYAIDARTGVEVARRVLAGSGARRRDGRRGGRPARRRHAPGRADLLVRPLAGRPRAPAPSHRSPLAAGHDDVLEAWAAPDGGLWLELEAATGTDAQQHALAYAFADGGGTTPAVWRSRRDTAEGPAVARDACAGGHELFAPVDGRWAADPIAARPLAPAARAPTKTRAGCERPSSDRARRFTRSGADDEVCAVAVARGPRAPRSRARRGVRRRPPLG